MRHARKSNSSMPQKNEVHRATCARSPDGPVQGPRRLVTPGTEMSSHQLVVLDAGVSGMSASTTSKSDLLDIHQC